MSLSIRPPSPRSMIARSISPGSTLLDAAKHQDAKTVKLHVSMTNSSAAHQQQGQTTALMHAAEQGYYDIAKLLVDKEAGCVDSYGWTATMHAARNGHAEIVKILYKKEACHISKSHMTAMLYAAVNGHGDIVQILYDSENEISTTFGWTDLMYAAATNDVDLARALAPRLAGKN